MYRSKGIWFAYITAWNHCPWAFLLVGLKHSIDRRIQTSGLVWTAQPWNKAPIKKPAAGVHFPEFCCTFPKWTQRDDVDSQTAVKVDDTKPAIGGHRVTPRWVRKDQMPLNFRRKVGGFLPFFCGIGSFEKLLVYLTQHKTYKTESKWWRLMFDDLHPKGSWVHAQPRKHWRDISCDVK